MGVLAPLRWSLKPARGALGLAWVAALLLADAALCRFILRRTPYTEIDWTAYMEQIDQVFEGERNYTRISGGHGEQPQAYAQSCVR